MTYTYMCVHKFITGITTNCLLGDLIIHAALLMRGLMWSQPGTSFVPRDITVPVQLRRSLAVVGTSFFLLILICPFICFSTMSISFLGGNLCSNTDNKIKTSLEIKSKYWGSKFFCEFAGNHSFLCKSAWSDWKEWWSKMEYYCLHRKFFVSGKFWKIFP